MVRQSSSIPERYRSGMATTGVARTNTESATKQQIATSLFSIGMIAMGILSIISRDFAFGWQPVPAFQPGRGVLAAICGVFMVAFSVALLYRKTAAIAARVLLPFLLAWLGLKVPALPAFPLAPNMRKNQIIMFKAPKVAFNYGSDTSRPFADTARHLLPVLPRRT
jgi:hypothetical protein